MQVLHRSGVPQEEGLSGDSVGDAQLAVLASDPRAWVVLQVERWVARFAPPLKQFACPVGEHNTVRPGAARCIVNTESPAPAEWAGRGEDILPGCGLV